MSERLHYFTEASTPVSFDCSDSDIDSDQDDLFRRPISEHDRLKQHARQLQLWSDEARRRRSPALSPPPPSPPSTTLSPHRRPSSSVIIHDTIPNSDFPSPSSTAITSAQTPDFRPRLSADRQQSNLSERARPASRRVSRSYSAKNLRIRITPSSSSKSLLSDIESELGQSAVSAPQSPRLITLPHDSTKRPSVSEKPSPVLPPTVVNLADPSPKESPVSLPVERRQKPAVFPDRHAVALGPLPVSNSQLAELSDTESSEEDSTPRSRLGRRLSFVARVKRIPSLRKLWRR